jgi:hypothetical protein
VTGVLAEGCRTGARDRVVDYEVASDVALNLSAVSPVRSRQSRIFRSGAWPPREARDEVLYLAGAALQPTPVQGSSRRQFLSAPHPAAEFALQEEAEDFGVASISRLRSALRA